MVSMATAYLIFENGGRPTISIVSKVRIEGVPMNNLGPMKNGPGVQGNLI